MRIRIQRAVMMGGLIAASVGAGACLAPPGKACGDGWCPEGYLCTPIDRVCVMSGCGNGILEDDEACDDGNLEDGDSCLSTCELATCGDGKVNLRAEACDDGNLDDDDGCLSTCELAACGDGKVDFRTEACDDGNSSDEDDCLVTCERNTCRDGFLDRQPPNTEVCDDGNPIDKDGCDNDCTISLAAYLKASGTDPFDYFGHGVALSADGATLAIGVPQEDSSATGAGGNPADNYAMDSGAVYVFTRSGSTWSLQAYLKGSHAGPFDWFGSSVALAADGATLAIGAMRDISVSIALGAVHVFTRSGSTWSQEASITAPGDGARDEFGCSVALSADGSTLAIGAAREDSAATGVGGDAGDNSAMDAGAVHVFTRSGSTWSHEAYLKASNTGPLDYFGTSVALAADGATLAVGAPGEDSEAGAIYVFTRSGTTWSQEAYVKASDPHAGDELGHSVALSMDGSTLAAGAPGEDQPVYDYDAGAAYVFTRDGTTWSQEAQVKASNPGNSDEFGYSVALSADDSTLVVGATGESSSATGLGGDQGDDSAYAAGAVYVFARSGMTWSQEAYVKASNTDAQDHFGHSVALSTDGSILAASAPRESSAGTGLGGNQADNSEKNAGAVYVFPRLSGR